MWSIVKITVSLIYFLSNEDNVHQSASLLIIQYNTVGLSELSGYFLLCSLLETSTYRIPEISKMRTWPAWTCLSSPWLCYCQWWPGLEWAFIYQLSWITDGRQIISLLIWSSFSWTQVFCGITPSKKVKKNVDRPENVFSEYPFSRQWRGGSLTLRNQHRQNPANGKKTSKFYLR
jgi:hypothetical protein